MTPTSLPTTSALESRLDRLRDRAASVHEHIMRLTAQHDALLNYICDTIFTLEASERRDLQAKCKHEDFTENRTGRTCRECGLETK